MQQIPRYYEAGAFTPFHDYFLSKPHAEKVFAPGEYLWKPGELLTRLYYIESGLVQTSVEHENGRRKILSFSGPGSINAIGQRQDFKLENSIVTRSITETRTLVIDNDLFYEMMGEKCELALTVVEWHARLANRLIYEVAHQEYNSLFIKLCNLLYLFSQSFPENREGSVSVTQTDLADILAVNRVNVSKVLARLREEGIITTSRSSVQITDFERLTEYCSLETRSDSH